MNYFKNTNNEIFAYDEEQVAKGYGKDFIAITVEEKDLIINPIKTPEQLQAEVNAEAKVYLASTDWYVVRQSETGVVIPADILQARAEARLRIVGE